MSEIILKAVAGAIGAIETRIDDLSSKIAAIPTQDLSHIKTIDEHKGYIDSISADVAIISAEFTSLKSSLSADFSNLLSSTEEKLAKLNSANDDAFAILSSELGQIKAKIQHTQVSFDSLSADAAIISAEFTSLKSSLSADFNTLLSSTEEKLAHLNSANDDTLALLSKALGSIKAEIQHAQVSIDTLHRTVPELLFDLEKKIDSVKGLEGPAGQKGEAGADGADGADGAGIHAPIWAEGITREGTIVQHNIGQMFKSLRDTVTEPGTSDDWARVGTFGLKYCGSFKEGIDYQVGDIFIKSFSTFMSVGKDKHLLLSARGAKGDKGDRGDKGTDGAPSTVPGPAGNGIKAVHSDNLGFVLEDTAGGFHPVVLTGYVSHKTLLEAFESSHDFKSLRASMIRCLKETS